MSVKREKLFMLGLHIWSIDLALWIYLSNHYVLSDSISSYIVCVIWCMLAQKTSKMEVEAARYEDWK